MKGSFNYVVSADKDYCYRDLHIAIMKADYMKAMGYAPVILTDNPKAKNVSVHKMIIKNIKKEIVWT